MNVLLAIPTGGNPAPPFLASLGKLRLPDSATAFARITIVGNYVPGQRELAARRAQKLGADILVMIDDDMILPPDALVKLLTALSVDPQLAVVGPDRLHPRRLRLRQLGRGCCSIIAAYR